MLDSDLDLTTFFEREQPVWRRRRVDHEQEATAAREAE
jgi:hypothetical protein